MPLNVNALIDVNAFECRMHLRNNNITQCKRIQICVYSCTVQKRCKTKPELREDVLHIYNEIVSFERRAILVYVRNINTIMIVKPATAATMKIRTATTLATPTLKQPLLAILTMLEPFLQSIDVSSILSLSIITLEPNPFCKKEDPPFLTTSSYHISFPIKQDCLHSRQSSRHYPLSALAPHLFLLFSVLFLDFPFIANLVHLVVHICFCIVHFFVPSDLLVFPARSSFSTYLKPLILLV